MNYSTAIKNARMTVVKDAIDAGSGPGKVIIYDAGYTNILVSIPLSDSCGTVAAGELALNGMPKSGDAVADGTAAVAKFVDSNDLVVADDLSVGVGSGFNIQIDGTDIHALSTVVITAGTIRHG